MIGRSRPQARDSAQSTASTIVSLVMLIAAGVGSAYAQTNSPTAAWIQVGTGTGPAKVSIDKSSSSGATVSIEIPGIQTESVTVNGAQYTKLTIPGAVSTGFGVGKAEVPSIPVLLARPTGSAVTFSVLSVQTETLHVARVFPMQPSLTLGEQAGPLVIDNSFYVSDVDYPSSRLGSPCLATWRDLDVVNVQVYPIVVRPAQHEVVVTSRITFRADFSGGHYPTRVASWMQSMYRCLVQNYDELGFTPSSSSPAGTKCLVFCDTAYADNQALLGLLDTMTMLGDSTELIKVPDDVPNSPGLIKQRITERYVNQNHALQWVLLVGECDQILPKQGVQVGMDTVYTVSYSDYWYSDLTYGDTNLCDNYPEVGIARLSPNGLASDRGKQDLSHQISKIMNYMMGRDTGEWLDTTTLVAHTEDPRPAVVRSVATDTTLRSFFPDEVLDTIMGCDAFDNSDIANAVDGGRGALIYLGHGDRDRWWHWNTDSVDWREEEVRSLHNQHTPVVFNIACYCSDLSQPTCLSEQWMRRCGPDSAGAVASFGSTDKAWTPPAIAQCSIAVMATGDYWTGVQHDELHKYGAPVFDLGGIQMLMDAYIASQWWSQPYRRFWCSNIYSFMWLGNPAMQIWSGGIPETAHVTFPSWIPTGGPHPFQVTVTIDGLPVESAQVCAYKEDDFYVVGSTGPDGTATLFVNASSVGPFSLSASKGHEQLSSGGQPHTPMLPYFGTSIVSASPPYSTSDMTYPNWSRKLVRDPENNALHVAYTAEGSVFYTQSTDAGVNWSTPEPIGAGSCPAIILIGESKKNPWVVYLTPDSSILRAIPDAGHSTQWDTATIFHGSLVDGRAGAPSMAAGNWGDWAPCGNVVYPVYNRQSASNYVCFNWFTPFFLSARETLDAAGTDTCYGASIAVTPLNLKHVAWTRGHSVFYRQGPFSGWSPPTQISSSVYPFTEPASNPSMEAYGDSVFCVWRGPNDLGGLPGDVWRRSRWLTWDPWYWPYEATNQSKSPLAESDFPVMITSFVTVWHEQVPPDNVDIWGRFLLDSASHPFFQTALPSSYPHVDGYWNEGTFRCDAVWTEQLSSTPPPPLYALWYGARDWPTLPGMELGPNPHEDYEPASYYAANLGRPEQSPYCLSRGGHAKLGSWDVDTSATILTYQLPYLDLHRNYKLRAIAYHEGSETWSADLRCDSGPWHRLKVAPHVPDTFWLQVPRTLYKRDARIVAELARVTGGYVSLAGLKLFQIKEQAGDGGGAQSVDRGREFVTRLGASSPNPFAKGTSVSYEIGFCGPVELTVLDVTGRLVRRLESGPRAIGRHVVRWDGADSRGHAAPVGVYFVRFCAGAVSSTGRLTRIR